jgi:ABC-type spermidine/putrescine transport system permease subunit I
MTAVTVAGSSPARPLVDGRLAQFALLIPALALVTIFFALPAIYMLRMSFNAHEGGQSYSEAWTLANYLRLLTEPIYLFSLGKTFLLALVTAAVTVVFAYIFALYLWLQRGWRKLVFLAIALCPLLISEISIIFGWWMFFPNNGLLSITLLQLGLIEDKISLMYTVFAAIVGLTYISLPFGIFILLSIFDGIDRRVLEAASDLGAPPLQTFGEVLFPLTRSGIVVAFSQAFVWTIGTYATPIALGPDSLWTIGLEIYQQMNTWRDWPFASALAMVLILLVLGSMALTRRLTGRDVTHHV